MCKIQLKGQTSHATIQSISCLGRSIILGYWWETSYKSVIAPHLKVYSFKYSNLIFRFAH